MGENWKPHLGQKRMTRLIVSQGAAGLLADPGVGKTSSILAAIRLLRDARAIRRTLIFAPIRVRDEVWPEERKKWSQFHDLTMTVIRADDKEEKIEEKSDIYVTSFSLMEWVARKLGWYTVERADESLELQYDRKRAEISPFDMLVIDESTAFKNTTTNRFKLMRKLAPQFKRRYIATGTPSPNGLINLFGQVYVLDLGNALGAYVSHFKRNFFIEDKYTHELVTQPGAEQRIYKAIAPLVIRLDADDYVDMPSRVETNVVVDLPPSVLAAYAELEEEFFVQLEEGSVTAANAAAMTAKLRQIANGGVYLDGGEVGHTHTAKIEATEEIVDELQGNPTLVAYEFKHDLARLQKAFPKAPWIGGGAKPADVKAAIVAWNRKEIPVLLVHPASAGHGLNLQSGGHHVIFHSLSYDLEQHDQLIRRLQRQGQRSKRVFVHRVVARGTIDFVMMDRLGRKDRVQRSLLAALRDYAKKKRR